MAGGYNRKVDYPLCGLIGRIYYCVDVDMLHPSQPSSSSLGYPGGKSKFLLIPETKHRHSVSNYTSVFIIHISHTQHRILAIQSFTLHYLS